MSRYSGYANSRVCFDFQKGKCTRGDRCRFSHEDAADEAAGKREPPVEDTEAEKRIDPKDGWSYTFEEVKQNYAHLSFSENDMLKFWDEDMQKIENKEADEKRIDPKDGKPYTFEEVKQNYAHMDFLDEDLMKFWNEDMQKQKDNKAGPEKRLDPKDWKSYTFEEVKQNYAHMNFSDQDILKFWEEDMHKVEESKEKFQSRTPPEDEGDLPGRLVNASRVLSRVLRHQAQELELSVNSDGFIPLGEVMQLSDRFPGQFGALKRCNIGDIETVIQTSLSDGYPRFEMKAMNGANFVRARHNTTLSLVNPSNLPPPPKKVRPEKRLDPKDGKQYTFEQVKENYAHMSFSDEDMLKFWDEQMETVQEDKEEPENCPDPADRQSHTFEQVKQNYSHMNLSEQDMLKFGEEDTNKVVENKVRPEKQIDPQKRNPCTFEEVKQNYLVEEIQAEKRIDPKDGWSYTFEEVKHNYAHVNFSEQDMLQFWDEGMKKMEGSKAKPEKRLDPKDGWSYTFEEVKQNYAHMNFSEQDMLKFWDEGMQKIEKKEVGPERRLDPKDRKPYTFEEVKQNYAHMNFSEQDMLKFWNEDMKKVKEGKFVAFEGKATGKFQSRASPQDIDRSDTWAKKDSYRRSQENSVTARRGRKDNSYSQQQQTIGTTAIPSQTAPSDVEVPKVGETCNVLNGCKKSGEGYLGLTVGDVVEILYIGKEANGDVGWIFGAKRSTGEKGWLPQTSFDASSKSKQSVPEERKRPSGLVANCEARAIRANVADSGMGFLPVSEGALVKVLYVGNKPDDDGWVYGYADGKQEVTGWMPCELLQVI